MLVITGAGGFIGSVIVGYLNQQGIDDIILFDDLPIDTQFLNLSGKKFKKLCSANELPKDFSEITAVIHFGADSNTLEKNWTDIYRKNVASTRSWVGLCRRHGVPLIFASSAAVYGNGHGPLNQYAFSKQISERELADACVLRLFNVYGPNEYHKGRMASTIYHWYQQYQKNRQIEIFENSDRFFRDFIYVEDVARIVHHFINKFIPGIYDVGTGIPCSFQDLAENFVDAVGDCEISYKSMPADLKLQYQTYTCANIDKLKSSRFDTNKLFTPANGVKKYIDYLATSSYL